ncbi:MAG: hypothetical protein ACYDEQ_01675 [Desulfocucumaceae bacterium]
MIEQVRKNPDLGPFIVNECVENGVGVSISEEIPEQDLVIIKMDKYYNSLNMENTPPSVDCLVATRCSSGSYVIYLVELKNIKSQRYIDLDNIRDKFRNAIRDFMSSRFRGIFIDSGHKIVDLKIYFVTDPLGLKEKGIISKEAIDRKLKNTILDGYLSLKPLRFNGKIYNYLYELPDPLIEAC